MTLQAGSLHDLKVSPKTLVHSTRRIDSVHSLRAIACLLVTFSHLTNARESFLEPSVWKDLFWHGRIGVQIFFVISGFVITHSLIASNYRLSDFFRFVFKRIVRLEPVYLIVVGYTALRLWQVTREIDWTAIALHVGYLIPFSEKPWLSIIFWTLAIEFQFYLFMGLLFPWICSPKPLISLPILGLFMGGSLLFPKSAFLLHWAPFFVLGIATALFYSNRLSTRAAFGILSLASGFCLSVETLPKAGAGIAAVFAIFVLTRPVMLLSFFADISYSLYLAHVPIGLGVIKFAERFDLSLGEKVIAIFVAFGASTFAAWVMWKYIEEPSRKFASRLSMKSKTGTPS